MVDEANVHARLRATLLNARSSRTSSVQRTYLARLDLPHAGQEKCALILLHAFVVQLAKLPGGNGSERGGVGWSAIRLERRENYPHRKPSEADIERGDMHVRSSLRAAPTDMRYIGTYLVSVLRFFAILRRRCCLCGGQCGGQCGRESVFKVLSN